MLQLGGLCYSSTIHSCIRAYVDSFLGYYVPGILLVGRSLYSQCFLYYLQISGHWKQGSHISPKKSFLYLSQSWFINMPVARLGSRVSFMVMTHFLVCPVLPMATERLLLHSLSLRLMPMI